MTWIAELVLCVLLYTYCLLPGSKHCACTALADLAANGCCGARFATHGRSLDRMLAVLVTGNVVTIRVNSTCLGFSCQTGLPGFGALKSGNTRSFSSQLP